MHVNNRRMRPCSHVALIGGLQSISKDVSERVQKILLVRSLFGDLRSRHESWVIELILVDVRHSSVDFGNADRKVVSVVVIVVCKGIEM